MTKADQRTIERLRALRRSSLKAMHQKRKEGDDFMFNYEYSQFDAYNRAIWILQDCIRRYPIK